MRNLQYKKFTLVELLAAMAVFSILLLVSMRLFSGAQQLWVRSEQKTNAFADARTAMEFVAVRLQTMVYYENVPFGMNEKEVWFATSMPMDNDDRKDEYYLRFLKFERDNDGKLVMKIFSGKENARKFIRLFPPFVNETAAEKAWGDVNSVLDGSSSDDVTTVELIENVTDFKVHGFFAVGDGSGWELKKQSELPGSFKDGSDIITPPYLMEIEISLLDNKEAYERWKEIDSGNSSDKEDKKDEIFSEYGYTFRRAILLGQRSGEK